MLTRSEMEEILSRHYDENNLTADDAFFEAMTDEEVAELFEQVYPDESQRRELEKSIREWTD